MLYAAGPVREIGQQRPGDAQQNPGVIGQEGPAGQINRSPDSGKLLLVFQCRYRFKPDTGRQPPPAASFPGLPEELMRTDAVITIASAHDARNAASRLAIPVPEGYIPRRSVPVGR